MKRVVHLSFVLLGLSAGCRVWPHRYEPSAGELLRTRSARGAESASDGILVLTVEPGSSPIVPGEKREICWNLKNISPARVAVPKSAVRSVSVLVADEQGNKVRPTFDSMYDYRLPRRDDFQVVAPGRSLRQISCIEAREPDGTRNSIDGSSSAVGKVVLKHQSCLFTVTPGRYAMEFHYRVSDIRTRLGNKLLRSDLAFRLAVGGRPWRGNLICGPHWITVQEMGEPAKTE